MTGAVHKWLKRDGRGRTGIIVAHRLSTIVSCDRILYLAKTNPDDAKSSAVLAEEGTHEQLLAMGGQYAAFAAQLASHTSDNVVTTGHSKIDSGDDGSADTPTPVDEQMNGQLRSVLALIKPHTGSSTDDGRNTTGPRDRTAQSNELTPAEVEAVANLRRTLERIEVGASRPLQ